MQGYDAASYGDGFADVYDEWYPDDDQTALAAEVVVELAGDGAVLELGVGTGRIAIPIGRAGGGGHGESIRALRCWTGWRPSPGAGVVTARLADMRGPLPTGPFRVVFVANNTLFNLDSVAAQTAAFAGRPRRAGTRWLLRRRGIRPRGSIWFHQRRGSTEPRTRPRRPQRPSHRCGDPTGRGQLHRVHGGAAGSGSARGPSGIRCRRNSTTSPVP